MNKHRVVQFGPARRSADRSSCNYADSRARGVVSAYYAYSSPTRSTRQRKCPAPWTRSFALIMNRRRSNDRLIKESISCPRSIIAGRSGILLDNWGSLCGAAGAAGAAGAGIARMAQLPRGHVQLYFLRIALCGLRRRSSSRPRKKGRAPCHLGKLTSRPVMYIAVH